MTYSYQELDSHLESDLLVTAIRLHAFKARSPIPQSPPAAAESEEVDEYSERLQKALQQRAASLATMVTHNFA